LPKIALLYTGGTIGSKVDYTTGGVYILTKPEELLYEVPELSDIANIELQNLMGIMSEDMTAEEWRRIATGVLKAFEDGARGVVITMGTDTMHYTAAALSFMLGNLKGPVVITGAQRSSDRGSSDAFVNLVCAANVAAKSDVAEVCICMHSHSSDEGCMLIRGTKARKMHTSRRDAFRPINNMQIADVGTDGEIRYRSAYRKAGTHARKMDSATGFEEKVALVKAYPNSDPGIIDYYLSKGYRGIIIEGTGLGHVPSSPAKKEGSWLGSIERACDKGMIIGMTSQCLYGRVNPRVYANLRLAAAAGAIYCEDMLPETAYVKLGWLLGNHSEKEAREMLAKDIAGEITERLEYDYFLR
jgi:glutamyl-tRNA(Gln) amidotransferase subunit D